MAISIGLDFGSMGSRAAYVLDQEIVPVPMPPDEAAWRGLVFVDPDPQAQPLGLTFSSLKYQLGKRKRFNWGGRTLEADSVVSELFASIKRAVETYAGEPIGRTVIAVPAQYPALRRSILRELAAAAGFGEVDLINDCTAAALGHTFGEPRPRTLLQYSMGFIGFEVSLVRYARQTLRELVHEGAAAPSGRNFDLYAMAAAIDAMHRAGNALPLKVFTSQWFDLRFLASDLKESLTTAEEAMLELPPFITGNRTARLRFSRGAFEEGIARDIGGTLAAVQQALDEAGMTAADVDEVVLVGGSTRLSIVQRQLESLFGSKLVQARDDLIARGAAVQALRLGSRTADTPALEAIDVRPAAPSAVSSDGEGAAGATPAAAAGAAAAAPPEPDLEALLAYARELAANGRRDAAATFLLKVESSSRELRDRLPEV